MTIRIFPSLLAADFGHLQAEVDRVAPYADGLHVDIMDGHFVPNLSFGLPVFSCLETTLPLHCHLMVTNPEAYVESYAQAKVHTFIFHVEVMKEKSADFADTIRAAGMSPGISLNPDTPVDTLFPILAHVDTILFMSVFPGFGGQKFIPEVLEKVRIIKERAPHIHCAIDGGINEETARLAKEAGCTDLIAGSYIFGGDVEERIGRLRG